MSVPSDHPVIRIPVLSAIPYPSLVVGLCLLAITSSAIFRQGMGAMFPFIQEDLGLNLAQLGLLGSGTALGAGATALLGGWLADVVGVRRLLTITLVVAAAAVILFSQMQSLAQGFLAAVLMGIAFSATFPSCAKAIMGWVRPRTRAVALGSIEASIPVGGIVAALFLTFLAVTFSWRTAAIISALMIAVSAAVFFSLYRNIPVEYVEREQSGRSRGRVNLVARNRDIWLTALYSVAFSGVVRVIISYLILFLRDELDMSAGVAAAMLAVALAGSAVGRVCWGLVSDLLLGGRRVVLLALTGTLSGISLALLSWLPSDASLATVSVLVFFVGAVCMGFSGLYTVLMAELAGPALTGTALGLGGMIGLLGSFAVPPLFGLVVDRTSSYDTGWLMMVGVAAVGTLFLAFMRPEARRS